MIKENPLTNKFFIGLFSLIYIKLFKNLTILINLLNLYIFNFLIYSLESIYK